MFRKNKIKDGLQLKSIVASIFVLLIVQMLALPVAVSNEAAGRVLEKPKIIIIPTCEASSPYQLQKAKEEVRSFLDVSLYSGTGKGYLPPAEGLDLSAYDVIFVVGNSPATFKLNQALDEAKKKATVVVVAPVMVEGNVDLTEHPWLEQYWFNRCQENFRRLMIYLGVKFCGLKTQVEKPIVFPERAIYHPDAKRIFETTDDYLRWYIDNTAKTHHIYNSKMPTIGILFYRSSYTKKKLKVIDALIKAIEKRGCNAIALYGFHGFCLDKFFIKDGKPVIDSIISLTYSLGYSNQQKEVEEAESIDVPFLQALKHYRKTSQEWEGSLEGLATDMLPYVLYAEMDGMFEPMLIAGKVMLDTGRDHYKVIDYQIDWRVERAIAWARLHRMKNWDKKIAITYYSEGGGKANIGADIDYYLDVPSSLANLFKEMKSRGYNLGDKLVLDSAKLSKAMAEVGSNVGVWAQGELRRRVKDGSIILIPEQKYLKWFSELSEDKRNGVIERWGQPPGEIMVYKDSGKKYIVIPKIRFGNVILLPHPTWGFLQDEAILYHQGATPPHHQYMAFWFWLNREFKADAVFTAFTQISLMPGKQIGLSRHDWGSLLLQHVPNIHPFPIQGNGGVHNKRRANALLIDYMPTIVSSELYGELLGLQKKMSLYEEAHNALKEEYKEGILKECTRLKLDKDLNVKIDLIQFEDLIGKLNHYLDQIKREHMPYGSHTLSEPPTGEPLVEMISSMLGKEFKEHITKLNSKKERLGERLLKEIILNRLTPEEAQKTVLGQISREIGDDLNLAIEYARRIDACHIEIPRILDAFEGKYILPGPMDDPIRNPDALPTGRNPYTFDTRSIPTKEAWQIGKRMVDQLLEQHLNKNKKYPRQIAFVLWSSETTKHHGIMEAEILYLLGVKPIWDKKSRVEDVELIDKADLERPRIDVLVITSGLYREHFQNQIRLIDKAVRLATEVSESSNYVKQNARIIESKLLKNNYAESEAVDLSKARVFSEAMGAYSPNLQFAVPASDSWQDDTQLSDLYVNRMGHTYGENVQSKQVKDVFRQNLKTVKAGVFSRSSNVYGVLDHPMVAAYFGGLKLAVRNTSNKKLDMYITNLKDKNNPEVETLEHFFNRELRSRYFNPKWIRGMMEHKYDGARYMATFTEDLWIWDVTSPEMITEDMWNEVNEVYVKDKYNLDLKNYFNKNNPHAFQSIVATMLDVVRKGYWDAPEGIKKSLAKEYAISVIEKGIACCHHTCNNPALNQMVVNIISLPGLLSPELVNQFQAIISKAMGMSMEEAVEKRKTLQEKLAKVTEEIRQEEKVVKGKKPDKEKIEGYEMVEEKPEDTKITVSGSSWIVMAIVIGLLSLLAIGWRKKI